MRLPFLLTMILILSFGIDGQNPIEETHPFKQIDDLLPTPNVYRAASGAPGPSYWQQQADYEMDIVLDDENQRIYGEQTVTYYNNSPHPLSYLWLQLDQNRRAKDSDSYKIQTSRVNEETRLVRLMNMDPWFDGGFKLDYVKDNQGADLDYTVNKTMMRIDLEEPLQPGNSYSFQVKWWYNINDRMKIGGRSGLEYFPEDDNYLYTIAQFFPRMCVYDDINGWQHKQFLGRGEFAVPFGNYEVKITAPADHLVSATGTLENAKSILPKEKVDLLEKAKSEYTTPIIIYSEEEAEKREETKVKDTKTWHFSAENVRDFAFASSRKFIWDAMAIDINDKTVLAMSMYPKEGNPLWEKYSTKAVAHTLKWYSHYTIDYPYPVAWSINAARIGMEYPMICFNYGRPADDGTYPPRTKYGMIGVIIHEVGHNFFPMIINSDERQWTWMDEGLNTFVQYLTEQQWERNYPSRRGPAHKITYYMGGDKDNISPIMTNSESIFQFGNNAYGKPATALNILRETIMGRELFDHAFKTYSERWKFKHPSPADFFRTMEDASAVDLDWFWRGWFYTNQHVDIAIDEVEIFKLEKETAEEYAEALKQEATVPNISMLRYESQKEKMYAEIDTSLVDFYTGNNAPRFDAEDEEAYNAFLDNLSEEQLDFLEEEHYYYNITFENKGGLVMPIILRFDYADGTEEIRRIPAEIWKMGRDKVTKAFETSKQVEQIELDPFYETADTERDNNYFPPQTTPSRFELFEKQSQRGENPMQRARRLN